MASTRSIHPIVAAALLCALSGCGGASSDDSFSGTGGATGTGGSTGALPGDDDCKVDGQSCPVACDASLGCVDCVADSDCGAAQPFCVVGRCVECGDTGDCGTGRACFPSTHTCEVACTSDDACTSGSDARTCDEATGVCLGCIADSDCAASTPICEPTLGTCGECASNADCGVASPVCDLESLRCVECIVDEQCGAGATCTERRCRALCTADADCTDTRAPKCRDDGECVACLAAADCPASAPVCDVSGRCQQCAQNADCPADSPICKGDECVECDRDEDCADGFKCKGSRCEED